MRVVRLEEKGRGRALHAAWSTSDAPVLAYMDVDLSTDLAALAPLVAPLISGHSDLAIGTRLGRGSRVVRGPKREIISRCYNLILKSTLAAGFSDAQCGFKAIRADVAHSCCPTSQTPAGSSTPNCWCWPNAAGCGSTKCRWTGSTTPTAGWTSSPPRRPISRASARLLRGFADGAIPVQIHRRATRVRRETRLRRAHCCGQAVRFAAVGVASTAAYLLLFMMLHGSLGAQAANLIALLLTAIGNTAANRRFTFGVAGRARGAPPLRRADRVRHRAGDHQWFAGPAAHLVARTGPVHRTRSCWWRPTCWPPPRDSSCCEAGCSTRAATADLPETQRNAIDDASPRVPRTLRCR